MQNSLIESNSSTSAGICRCNTTVFPTHDNLLKVGENLLLTKRWTDCSFEVGSENTKQIIEAHRFILAVCSPVFEAMFFGPLANTDGDEIIKVPDIEPNTFLSLLEYIYRGKDCLSEISTFDDVSALYYAAHKYMLGALIKLCTDKLVITTNVSNACKAYEMAKMCNDKELSQKSLNIIEGNMEEILDHPWFVDVRYDTLLEIFNKDSFNVYVSSEIVYHDALFKWIRNYCEKNNMNLNDKHVVEMIVPALKKIDFASMTNEELSKTLVNPLLTEASKKARVPSRVFRDANISKLSKGKTYSAYASPSLIEVGILRNKRGSSYSMKIMSNCDLTLSGIKVLSQKTSKISFSNSDSISIYLRDSSNNKLGSGFGISGCQNIDYWSISFTHLIPIQKKKVYTLTAHYDMNADFPLLSCPDNSRYATFISNSVVFRVLFQPGSFCFFSSIHFAI